MSNIQFKCPHCHQVLETDTEDNELGQIIDCPACNKMLEVPYEPQEAFPAIFIIRSQQPTGPYSDTEITDMLRHGEVTLSEPAWAEGDPDWTTVAHVMGLEAPPLRSSIPQPPPIPPRQNEPISPVHQYKLPQGMAFSQNILHANLECVGSECSGHSIPAAATVTQTALPQTTDIFAILAFATGMLGFFILPIIFTPICYVCAIISYYRLKENPNLKGKGLRLTGAILGALSLLYMFYQFGIIG